MDVGDIKGLDIKADFSTGIIGISGLPDELIIDMKEEIGTLSIDPQDIIVVRIVEAVCGAFRQDRDPTR